MKLYEIGQLYRDALETIEIDPETGEVLSLGALPAIQADAEEKEEATACFIKEKRAEAAAIKAEKLALDKRQKSAEKTAERLTEYLAQVMAETGQQKVSTPRCTISWRKSSAVEVEDETLLPEAFRRVKIEPNKTEIKKALQAGEAVPGARIAEGRSLQIK